MRWIESVRGVTRRWRTLLVFAGLFSACAACTLLLNRSATQCATNADCAAFGSPLVCTNGVCAPSGLGPAGCFTGDASTTDQFLNACTANLPCFPFDNCNRLGLCNTTDGGPSVPPPEAGTPEAAPPPDASSSDGSADGGMQLPPCQDPVARPNVVYISGTSNFPPLLQNLAPIILKSGVTPVFQISSSCTGVDSIFNADPAKQLMKDPPPSAAARYPQFFDGSKTPTNCALGAPVHIDVGVSDIFSTTCPSGPAPGGIGEYLGPIEPMVFIVPGKSSQTTLSAAAARAVFGQGGAGGGAGGAGIPWTDPTLYFVRNAGTGTQQMIAHAIGVPAGQFWGVDRGTAKALAGLMINVDDKSAEQAIGIISTDVADANRNNLRVLAFQDDSQPCGFLPDATLASREKINVRDGHYPIWGPMHFFTAVSNAIPVSPGAQSVVNVLTVPALEKDVLDAFIDASLVPACAMKVHRSTELGDLSAFTPPLVCGCYFEARTNGAAPADCQPCQVPADCQGVAGRPACNLGFCEVQ